MSLPLKRALVLPCVVLLAFVLASCAKTVSTSGYSGESKEVAQKVSDLQADVTAGDQKKICSNDLSSALVGRLNAARGGCQQAVKNQVVEVDNFELTVESIQLGGTPAQRTATVNVLSVKGGKKRPATLALTKESGKWKISGLG